MSKRPMGHGPLKNMRDFKAVAVDYEYYLTLSDDPVSVCLTERQMYVLSVQNTYTSWLTRWYNTDDINQNVVVAIAAEIEALLMCGCGIPQPTITDRLNTRIYNDNTTTIYQNTENTWNAGGQTVISIAPNLDWDTGDPIDIAKLTCAAIRNLLNAIAGQGKQMNQMTADQNKDLVNGISSALGGLSAASGAAAVLAGLGVGVVGFFASPWLTFGLALGAVGTKIGSLFIAAPPTLFDDTEAIEKVACAMINNTDDDTMTREKFVGALTPNDFAPGSPEAQLAAMVQPYLDDLTVYLQFMSLGNQLYEISDFALLPECGCGEPSIFNLVNIDQEGNPRAQPVYVETTELGEVWLIYGFTVGGQPAYNNLVSVKDEDDNCFYVKAIVQETGDFEFYYQLTCPGSEGTATSLTAMVGTEWRDVRCYGFGAQRYRVTISATLE